MKSNKQEVVFIDVRSGYGGAEKYFDNLTDDLSSLPDTSFHVLKIDLCEQSFFDCIVKLFGIKRSQVVFNMSVLGIGLLYLIILKLRSNNVILYPHLVTNHARLGSKLPMIRQFNRYLTLKISDKIVSISDGNYNILKKDVAESKIIMVYNYIRFGEPILNTDKARGIAIIGRLQNKHKKQVDFINFFAHFILENELKVNIFGSGPDEDELNILIDRYGLNKYVKMHGWVAEDEIYLSPFDVVLSLSEWEGLPLNILEAFSRGKAVIGRRIDGVQELLYGDFLFNNFNELQHLLDLYISKGIDSKLIRLNSDYVLKKYSKEKSLSVLYSLIKGLK